jgi:CRISPR-associated protein Csm1
MTITQIYLYSLQQDLLETGHFNHISKIPLELMPLLDKAKTLAGGTSNGLKSQNVASIFSHVQLKGQKGQKRFYPIEKMSLKKGFFPSTTTKLSNDFWSSFIKEYDEVVQIHVANEKVLAETLLHVLHKYATVIPSNVGEEISLYDYAKMKACIAICLSNFDLQALPEKPLLMVGGNVSGIQEYIYDIVSKNASKNLKGRSYFVQLLVDTILHKVLEELGLFYTNIVFGSGGKFFLLAPNTDIVKAKIDKLESEISKNLYNEFKTMLSLFLAWQEIDVKTLIEDKDLGTHWGKLYGKLDLKKSRKFSFLIADSESTFFNPNELGGTQQRDSITNEELQKEDFESNTFIIKGAIPKKATSEEIRTGVDLLSKVSYEQIMLGFLLKSEMYRLTGHISMEIDLPTTVLYKNNRKYSPINLDVSHYILNDNKFIIDKTKRLPSQILTINDYSFLKKSDTNLVHGFEYYGGNDYPKVSVTENGYHFEVSKTFSEMAGMAENEREYVEPFTEFKFKRFAVLKMDIDSLGELFKSVFKGYGSLSHYASLSRHIDWFFKGYLNTIWSETTERKENTQIIYSGGDDLFIVGKWDLIIEFAQRIREDFKEWTCQNQSLTISGGIAIVTPKFPISKSADIAKGAEKYSKNYYFDGKKKNAITLFGTSLNWDYEYKIVKMLKEEICKLSNASQAPLPRTFIYKINGYYEMAQSSKSLSWRWQIAYDLKRLAERSKRNAEVRDFLEELVQWSMTHNIPKFVSQAFTEDLKAKKINFFKLLNIAVIWASYELRN